MNNLCIHTERLKFDSCRSCNGNNPECKNYLVNLESERRKYRLQALEGRIDSFQSRLKNLPKSDDWQTEIFKLRIDEAQLEYRELTGREYE